MKTLVVSNKHDINQGILYLTFLKNSMDVEIDIKQLADYLKARVSKVFKGCVKLEMPLEKLQRNAIKS